MAKKNKSRYILSLKLYPEKFQEDIINTRFEIARQLYNAVLGVAMKRYREMVKTRAWRQNQQAIFNIYDTVSNADERLKLCKPYFKIKQDMMTDFGMSEYALHSDVKYMQNHFKKNIHSDISQKIASTAWKALSELIYNKGNDVHFKKYNQPLNSVEGKSNKTGIQYKSDKNIVVWSGLNLKCQSKFNDYEMAALRDKICFCRIVRKFVRGKYKYTLQLVLDGIPPLKYNRETGEVLNDISIGDVGLDIGTQTVAIVSNMDVKLYELAPRVQNIEIEKRRLQRKMDRSQRATNPDNFNKDGTIKRGVKLVWTYSNKHIKYRNTLKDLYRKQADIRRQDHNIMANEIIHQGDTIKVETMNFKALQKRAKNTTINEKTGRINKKKRFGKSLANKAPAMFLTILQNKLSAKGGIYLEINTAKVKASQYNHFNKECVKKKLSQRWNNFNGIKVQRDIYSAFLIKNVINLDTIDNDVCTEQFNNFLNMHNLEIERLKLNKNLSSIGIR